MSTQLCQCPGIPSVAKNGQCFKCGLIRDGWQPERKLHNPANLTPEQGDWSVAVHNDYRISGRRKTFWLWTHPLGIWVKGEGESDEIALKECLEKATALFKDQPTPPAVSRYKCEVCKDTGFYGDNGPGIKGNREYQACDQCPKEPAVSEITERGQRIPPIAGDPPCDEYDPAGPGAGVEEDGQPQCAQCGHSKSAHKEPAEGAQSVQISALSRLLAEKDAEIARLREDLRAQIQFRHAANERWLKEQAALAEAKAEIEKGRQWNNLLELELGNLRSLKPTCFICAQLMAAMGEDGTDFVCDNCDRAYCDSQVQLRLCEQHAASMAKDFDASLAVVQGAHSNTIAENAKVVASLEAERDTLRAENTRLSSELELAKALESAGVAAFAKERRRQIEKEDWSTEHDDAHTDGSLALAAICYAEPEMLAITTWPWGADDWKPSSDRLRNLAKAGAILAAEYDRLTRLQSETRKSLEDAK